ncbi:chitinase N-terminal domain-containing protein [Lacimicrobium alkaliphilum]|uniref:Chitinase A N-terminal domain-containing protein n=1 Tax=Lacimicrobium alkaliphilum TaxID=1526571 RepID=A0ABQ1RR23_9ALTE|nr:chitinase N-terminal domain-containing protein [Lacimicrobium alkaliphilum]GGD76146.1 hypothetical protein GCM10011357_33980 [Lacimicrobium alkaliphilum]
MKRALLTATLLNAAGLLFAPSILAAPGTPNIAWMETSYGAPAQYTIQWNMWWGNNGDTWYLLENGSVVHTGNLTPNGKNAQSGQTQISQSSGGSYAYQVKLCDTSVTPESCTQSNTTTISVSGDAVNQPPVVNAGNDLNTEPGSPVNLSGSVEDDGLSGPLDILWTRQSGPGTVTFGSVSAPSTTATFNTIGTYVLRLTANDGEFSAFDDVQVVVADALPNQPPIADAGNDASASLGQPLTLTGTFQDDGKTSPVTQIWSKVSGPGIVSFSDASSGTTQVTFDATGSYILAYMVNDSEFSDSDQLTVTVTDGPAPEAPAAPAIAWMPTDLELTNGSVDVTISWNLYWGKNGNQWRLLKNNTVVHSAPLTANGNSAQSGQHTVTLTQGGSYDFEVALCNVVGNQEACTGSSATTVTVAGGGGNPVLTCGPGTTSGLCLPSLDDQIDLYVKGWPNTLAMGTLVNNDPADNAELAASQVNAIYQFTGNDGRGQLLTPEVTRQTITQARQIGTQVRPVLVANTADASQSQDLGSEDILNYNNLVIHYRNLIRQAAQMQVRKNSSHEHPATLLLNTELLGQWFESPGTFTSLFGEPDNWTTVQVQQALQEAISLDSGYQVEDNNGNLHSLGSLYNLNELQSEAGSLLSDNLKGWVQSQHFILKRFSPDIPFAWVVNLEGNTNTSNLRSEYSGLQAVWNGASEPFAAFLLELGLFDDADLRPDFLAFDKGNHDGFSPDGKEKHAFGPRQWQNYLNYVRQITEYFEVPAMLWQLPGGHLATTGESIGDYDLANHSASAGSYFMGDKNIGANLSAIRPEVLNIPLDAQTYGSATSVGALLNQENEHDWGTSQLRHAAYANVFAILWGGPTSTSVVPVGNHNDNGWLKSKIVAYQNHGGVPLYHVAGPTSSTPLTSIEALNAELESIETLVNNEVFLYQTPSNSWIPSTVYKWGDFLQALNAMHNQGVGDVKFWLIDENTDEATNILYAKVAIAAFLAQSMKETIQYNACDENNWSINTGDPVNYPLSSSCGQLQQNYSDYGVNPATGNDYPYSCPVNMKMEMTANTHAKWYGAPAPLFVAPDAVLEELGLLVNGNVGKWNYSSDCSNQTGTPDLNKQAWLREECKVYDGQKAGRFVWDGSAGKSVEGCGWWGRGVIQTTGRFNFGKLNHFLGRSHVDPALEGQVVEGMEVIGAPANPLYSDMDLCQNPGLVCSTQEHKEIKWIAGLFYWMNEVQGYDNTGGPYEGWNYYQELKAYVEGGLQGSGFIDDISGIVNRGCPDSTCPISGPVDGLADRKDNFFKVLRAMGLDPQ